ncbi:ribosome biogenesis protein YTM1 [Bisporella sp. PMI_857]|nr:ribosome biogenesis protein YTM1 [Bisporella sp. PMI_857]
MDTPMAGTGVRQVQVQFFTKSFEDELPEGKQQLLVPTNIGRSGLSQILNSESMLGHSKIVPYQFLINGSFLRTTLEEYLTSHGLSAEKQLLLEYVRSFIPPIYVASFEHDDWVSSVDVLSAAGPSGRDALNFVPGQERILSGSYDGLLRVWNKSGQPIATSTTASDGGHTHGIKAAKFISPSRIASAGMDRTIRIWQYTESEAGDSGKLKPKMELYGHKQYIFSLAVHGPSNRILSAAGDDKIGLWTASESSAPEAPTALLPSTLRSKRRKISTSVSTPQKGPLSLISAHTGPVHGVIFNPLDPTVAYSCSQDHTARTFDLTTSSLVDTRTTSHPLYSITALPGISSQLLAAGTTARHITLLDPRVSASTTQVMTLRGHTNLVTSLSPNPESTYGLVSASNDGTCRVWDLRSTRQGTKDEGSGIVGEAMYIIERNSQNSAKKPVGGEGVKVFSVVWDKEVGIVSGGEDKVIQINRGQGITAATV